jgi:hypothetical protein
MIVLEQHKVFTAEEGLPKQKNKPQSNTLLFKSEESKASLITNLNNKHHKAHGQLNQSRKINVKARN